MAQRSYSNKHFNSHDAHLLSLSCCSWVLSCLISSDLISSHLQLALGHGARRLHVSAAFRAKAQVSMSRFEPTSFVNYEKLNSNVEIVRKRSGFLFLCLLFLTSPLPPDTGLSAPLFDLNVCFSLSHIVLLCTTLQCCGECVSRWIMCL